MTDATLDRRLTANPASSTSRVKEEEKEEEEKENNHICVKGVNPCALPPLTAAPEDRRAGSTPSLYTLK